MYFYGGPRPQNRELFVTMLGVLAAGMVGGLLTYLLPFTTKREQNIRRLCGQLLGIAADPARAPSIISERLAERVSVEHALSEDPKTQLICELIKVRAEMSQANSTADGEARTDELLAQILQSERYAKLHL